MSAEQADAVVDMLELDSEVALALQEIPLRGSLNQEVPTDPTIYRIHEVTQVYGTIIKALIHEEFGDGIMNAIPSKWTSSEKSPTRDHGSRSPTTASSSPTVGDSSANSRPCTLPLRRGTLSSERHPGTLLWYRKIWISRIENRNRVCNSSKSS
jgi:hypothetical protein